MLDLLLGSLDGYLVGLTIGGHGCLKLVFPVGSFDGVVDGLPYGILLGLLLGALYEFLVGAFDGVLLGSSIC